MKLGDVACSSGGFFVADQGAPRGGALHGRALVEALACLPADELAKMSQAATVARLLEHDTCRHKRRCKCRED